MGPLVGPVSFPSGLGHVGEEGGQSGRGGMRQLGAGVPRSHLPCLSNRDDATIVALADPSDQGAIQSNSECTRARNRTRTRRKGIVRIMPVCVCVCVSQREQIPLVIYLLPAVWSTLF